MEKLIVKGSSNNSSIFLGEKLRHLEKYLPSNKVIILTDRKVNSFYSSEFPSYPVIEIGEGEQIKTLDTVKYIYQKLLENEADRSYFIVGIGGGILCDIVGFVASTYMRGIRFGFVSTTLLSQVDASIGGKNGVNFEGYKNIIGVFTQPDFVICDFEMLKTLSRRDLISGFAEIVKHAAIKNIEMFNYLEENIERALQLDQKVLQQLVYDSLLIKSAIVEADEKEKGERRKLNFGHTFAHSFEKLYGVTHGEAVSLGMVLVAKISVKQRLLNQNDANRIEKLLNNLQLPVKLDFDKKEVFRTLKKDKKREGDSIHLVLLNGLGNAIVQKKSLTEMEEIINDLC